MTEKIHWPRIDIPAEFQNKFSKYLRHLVYQGAYERVGKELSPEYIKRIEAELTYIVVYSYPQYFIALYDIVRYARENCIWIGPGRGHTVGSIVCYCLFYDDIDPLKFKISSDILMWRETRFMPDVDLDISKSKRNKLLDYLRNKYGVNHVLRVKTYHDWNGVVHPCSFFILDDRTEAVPTRTMFIEDEGREVIMTDLTKIELEEKGYINFDFLNMDFVDVINAIRMNVEKDSGVELDLANININDDKILQLFTNCETDGIFLFGKGGMKKVLKELPVSSFEDLMALYVLYRPAAMEWLTVYISRRLGTEDIPEFTLVHDILKSTYGIPLYREQVVKLLTDIGKFSFGEAFQIYRLMERRRLDEESIKEGFENGCKLHGMNSDEGKKLWTLLCQASCTCTFDRGHAAAYTFAAYQMAWLKVYYPNEFYKIRPKV